MRAIRCFTISATLPEPLAPLRDLMLNLRWSWHAGTRDLFTALDPAGRDEAGRDPITLLGEVPPEHLARLAGDEDYLGRLHRAAADLREYLSAARWYQRGEQDDAAAGGRPVAIAYFSPEYGIAAALPQYSGGLGILAGDHLKAASDLGVPLIGVGLLYRHGYFSQSLSPEGWQLERYPAGDPNGLPLTLLRGSDGAPVTVVLALGEGSSLAAQVWLAQVGRVPLLLLDSYVEQNDPGLREVTDRLYGGGSEHRLRQELLLGMGGVRAVRAYCELTGHPQPEVFHTNEGHAGFLGVERIREYAAQGLSFEEAIELCRAGTVFTTHTPVPAGIDRFARDLVERQFGGDAADPALPCDRVLALGAETYPGGDPAVFNMAVMGMRLAQRVNGVSTLHGQVSREMFAGLWPGFETSEVPIGSITNGVHAASWVAPEIMALAAGGAESGSELPEAGLVWDRVAETGPARLWDIRRMLRRRLVLEARQRLRASLRQRGHSEAELGWTHHALDEFVLTVGFARRVPSYKRLTLMLHDPERLTALLLDPQRPVQIVIAGKAHPADDGGKQLIQQMVRFADDPRVRHRLLFLPDYDMALASAMVQGCDVWLNNPLRPLEASGTSGMKAALNGGLNLSVRTAGGTSGSTARTAGPSRRPTTWPTLPARRAGVRHSSTTWSRWWPRCSTKPARTGCRTAGWRWSRTRSPGSAPRAGGPDGPQYVETLYVPRARVPCARRCTRPAPFAAARDRAAGSTGSGRPGPTSGRAHRGRATGTRPGGWLPVRASVALGELSPEDVTVEVVSGRVTDEEDIVEPEAHPMTPSGPPLVKAPSATPGARLSPGPFGTRCAWCPPPAAGQYRRAGPGHLPRRPEGMTNGLLR